VVENAARLSIVNRRQLSQPNQDVLEGLANLDVQEGSGRLFCLSSFHRHHPNPTRMSWKGSPTWMSRKARDGRSTSPPPPSQPNQDILEGLANLDVQEGMGWCFVRLSTIPLPPLPSSVRRSPSIARLDDGNAKTTPPPANATTRGLEVYCQIRDVRPELQRRRLRLIHSGRLLTDGTFIYPWLTSLEDKQRRAIKEVTTEEIPDVSQALTWLHCSVGPEFTQEEEEENLTQVRGSVVTSLTRLLPTHAKPFS